MEIRKDCKVCAQLDFTRVGIEVDKYGARAMIGDVPPDKRFNFCPMCGKRLFILVKKEHR